MNASQAREAPAEKEESAMNRLSVMLGLLALALLEPARAELPQYVIRDLGNYGRATLGPAAINDQNQAVVTLWTYQEHDQYLFYDGFGEPPQKFVGKRAVAIDAAGKVLGYTYPDEQAFLWDGEFHDIPLNFAYDINDAGDVVGRLNDPYGGYLYSGGELIRLPEHFEPRSINNERTIGGVLVPELVNYPAIWQNGTMTWIGDFNAGINDINNLGWVIGNSKYGAYVKTDAEFLVIGSGTPLGINDSGRVVGQFGATTGAGVWEGGVLAKLPDFGGFSRAFAINNAGVIVGKAADQNDDVHLVAWEPVPEPASLLALGTGLAWAAVARRRTTARR